MSKQAKPSRIVHTFLPVYDESSKVLILGSLPSVKSRESNFYYGHPQNRFWKIIAALTDTSLPKSKEEKTEMLLCNNVAVWDVIHSCDIAGSDDSTINNVLANDLCEILHFSKVNRIFTNGKKADMLYIKYCEKKTVIKSVCLPSSSPANAAWSLDKLIEAWKLIFEFDKN